MKRQSTQAVCRAIGMMVGMGMMAVGGNARAVTTVFSDPITNYTVGSFYPGIANPTVTLSQNNGGGAPYVETNDYGITAPLDIKGGQMVTLLSGVYVNFDTLAVNRSSSDTYGQIFYQVAKEAINGGLICLGFANVANPQISNANTGFKGITNGTTTAGADVLLWADGNIYVDNGGGLGLVHSYPAGPNFFDLTINYNLASHIYDLWLNSTKIVAGGSFQAGAGFGSTVNSILIGGAYWGPGTQLGNDLGQWYWKSDNATPFTTFANPIPEPTSVGLVMLGSLFLIARRRCVRSLARIAIVTLALGCAGWEASAETNSVTLGDAYDTRIREAFPTSNFDGDTALYVGAITAGANVNRGLFEFDLSSIPTNAIILSADLRIAFGAPDSTSEVTTLSIYRLTNSWTRFGVTWNTRDGSTPWNTAGAGSDSIPTPSSALTSTFSGSFSTRVDFTFTNLVADVQLWVNHPSLNEGWLLRNNDEIHDRSNFATSAVKVPLTRDWTTPFDGTPYLVIQWIPEPMSGGLALLGSAFLWIIRRPRV